MSDVAPRYVSQSDQKALRRRLKGEKAQWMCHAAYGGRVGMLAITKDHVHWVGKRLIGHRHLRFRRGGGLRARHERRVHEHHLFLDDGRRKVQFHVIHREDAGPALKALGLAPERKKPDPKPLLGTKAERTARIQKLRGQGLMDEEEARWARGGDHALDHDAHAKGSADGDRWKRRL